MNRSQTFGVRPLTEFVQREHLDALPVDVITPVPSILRALTSVLLLFLITAITGLWAIPWVQTASGTGDVIALDPADRVQAINSLVDGRINRWFVEDGGVVALDDPIVEVTDVDPDLLQRLGAERRAVASSLNAARVATETALLDYERQKRLLADGLSSRRNVEAAKIKYQQILAHEAQARARLNKADIAVTRQSSQLVRAPQDGRIVQILAGNTATFVKAGDPVATFAPANVERAVQVYVSGLDAPLVQAGLKARVMFEGWPAVQFSGWPETAIGTFAGVVTTIDPVASADGRFRVLISAPREEPWPDDRYLRLGGQAQAWIQLGEVRLGYELWRRLNRFPPSRPAAEQAARANNK